MEKFKIAMGFPMLATAVWLFDLTTVHYGRRVFWLAMFLVVVALAAWVYGEFVQRGRSRKGLALAMVVAILGGGIFYVLEGQLMWRSPMEDPKGATMAEVKPGGIQWQPWSAPAVVAAQAAGHPVLVDFTADWCLVCQVNSKTSVNIERVQEKLKEINGVAMIADYTKLPVAITDELNHFGRATVPLVVVFPGDAAKAPEVLPDGYLTPGIVLTALDKASGK
jgi:thiol:disulfide interchange protein DsbD